MKQEVGGQPLWVWLAGAGVVILGYLYFRHTQSSSAPASQAPAGGKSTSTSSFKEWITQHQASSSTHKKHKKAA